MNFKKIAAAAASIAAAATLTVSASAGELKVSENPQNGLTSTDEKWLIQVYIPGQGIDLGMDPREFGKLVFTVTPTEPEDFEGSIGGAVVLSSGPQNGAAEDHNWPQANYWGVYDEDKELFTRDPETDTNPIHTEVAGDYIYTLTLDIDSTNNVQQESYDSPDCYVQIALSDWGQEVFSELEVKSLEIFDKSGALMGTFDGDGNLTLATAAAAPAAEAPAAEAPATDVAAAADTTAAVTSTKGSPDTGVADVAAVAGIAVVAAGAVVIAKKRK